MQEDRESQDFFGEAMSGNGNDNVGGDSANAATDYEAETEIINQAESGKEEETSRFGRGLNKESASENDPVLVLQLSQSMFVPDTLEDEGSLIIPPTPEVNESIPLIIPSTPTEHEDEDEEKEENTDHSEKEEGKEDSFTLSLTEIPDSPECRNSLEGSEIKSLVSELEKASTEDTEAQKFENSDDDWCLQLTSSEATQSLQLTLDEIGDKKNQDKDASTENDSAEALKRSTFSLETPPRTTSDDPPVTESQPAIHQDVFPSKAEEKSEMSSNSSNDRETVAETPEKELKSSIQIESEDMQSVNSLVQEGGSIASTQSDVEMFSDLEDVPAVKEKSIDTIEADDDTPDVAGVKRKVSDDDSSATEMHGPSQKVHEASCKNARKKLKTKEPLNIDDPATETEPLSTITRGDTLIKETQTIVDDMYGNLNTESVVGKYTDSSSLSELLSTAGAQYSSKDIDSIVHSMTLCDEREITYSTTIIVRKFIVKKDEVIKKITTEDHHVKFKDLPDVGVSPQTSTSTTSSKKVSHRSSITSGELADISSSISSSGFHHDSMGMSSQTLSSLDGSSEASVLSGKGMGASRQHIFSNLHSLELSLATSVARSSGANKASQGQLGKDAKLPILEKISEQINSEEGVFRKPKNPRLSSKRAAGRRKNPGTVSSSDNGLPPTLAANDSTSTEESEINIVSSNGRNLESSPSSKGQKKRFSRNSKRGSRKKKKQVVIPNEELHEESIPDLKLAPKLSIDESRDVDSPTPGHTILPGVRVMARWRDGFYYPGLIFSQEMEGRWITHFDDGAIRTITEENLLKIASLQAGTSVLVRSSDDFYDPGIVRGHYREPDEVGYIVELDNGPTKRFPRASVILSTDQANIILGYKMTIASPSSAVSLDNIVNGKRRRTPVISPAASPLRTSLKRRAKNPDSNLDSTESSANESGLVAKVLYAEDDEVKLPEEPLGHCDPQTTPLTTHPSRKGSRRPLTSRKTSRQGLQAQLPSSTSSHVTTDFSKSAPEVKCNFPDLVTTGKNIFQGYAFLMSKRDKKIDAKGKQTDFDQESGSDEQAILSEEEDPFNKEYLSNQIQLEGGMVYESFEESQKSLKTKKVFLLASSYLRTIKYIQCLASNTPCIRHNWISECLYNKEVVSYADYLLPAGYSILKEAVLEWHGKKDALRGLKIVLTSPKKPEFVETWTPVLLAAKADLVQKWTFPNFNTPGSSFNVDFIVTDASCPVKVYTAAKRRKIPVVSTEWVIQCLISGITLPHDSHSKFQYNFTE